MRNSDSEVRIMRNFPYWYRWSCQIWMFTGLPLLILIIIYAAMTGGLVYDAPVDFSLYGTMLSREIIVGFVAAASFLFIILVPLALLPFVALQRILLHLRQRSRRS